MDRASALRELESDPHFDVLVIGGGATGLGTALDAVSRGYRTLLVEAVDFAKGTSSRSTKLIHGGVRYLRSGQVRMVRESLHERGLLLQNAPHVVHQMQFVVPAYRFGERWFYWFGMKLYDFLAGRLNLERSRMLSREKAGELMPTIVRERLRGGVLYSDGQFDDARLSLSLAQTCSEHGGTVLNYMRVVGLHDRDGTLCGARLREGESNAELEVSAKVIINATGVFGESVMALDEAGNDSSVSPPRIVPSQGTHVVLDREFLPTDYAIMIPKTDDGRVLFVIPWYGKTLLGTTDHAVKEILEEPKPLDQEIDYLLEHAGRYLTKTPNRKDVRSVFSGLRPLVGKGNADAPTSTLSREHEIYTSPSGLISVIGGKWTTFRKMGQDVVDLAIEAGKLEQRESKSKHLKLVGAAGMGDAVYEPTDPLSVFGDQQGDIEALIAADGSLAEPIHERLPYLRAHVVFTVQCEMARTVEDVLSRRTRAILLDAAAAEAAAPVVAKLIASELGKDDTWISQQVAEFQDLAQGYQAH